MGGRMTRMEKHQEIARLRALGMTRREVGLEMGIPVSTVADIESDPDREKLRQRRVRYSGTCGVCGAATDGSAGVATPPPSLCSLCSLRSRRVWTRETVIDAAQRWASEHGRPPVAKDWLRSDPGKGFPSLGGVYGRSPRSPFACWADAIEAAGFTRPTRGSRPLKQRAAA